MKVVIASSEISYCYREIISIVFLYNKILLFYLIIALRNSTVNYSIIFITSFYSYSSSIFKMKINSC